jgi:hypothetical protein
LLETRHVPVVAHSSSALAPSMLAFEFSQSAFEAI